MMQFFSHPKQGIFKINTNKYGATGWIYIEETRTIIGKCGDLYVERIYESITGYWDEYGKYDAVACTPLGIHESYFVKWINNQLELF